MSTFSVELRELACEHSQDSNKSVLDADCFRATNQGSIIPAVINMCTRCTL